MHMYAYAIGCTSRTTASNTSKVQRRQFSVVRQTLSQLLGSFIADTVACKPGVQELSCSGELVFQ